jgi:hypothetical protein
LSFDSLFVPFDRLDAWLTGLLDGAPLAVALVLAFLLGLRHATDPDHLVAVTSLVASGDRGARAAARIGAWWGLGHALTLVLIGVPLIALKSELPAAVEGTAEAAVGLVIFALALRVTLKWLQGDYRASPHRHDAAGHRHLHRGAGHDHPPARGPAQAFALGTLHGLAGTGAVVVLLLAALPTRAEAAAALAVFAPMSIASMAAFTSAFAWALTRRSIEPVYRTVVIPALGSFGLVFGLWYAGLG